MGSGQSADTKSKRTPDNDPTAMFWRMHRDIYKPSDIDLFEGIEAASRTELMELVEKIKATMLTQRDLDHEAVSGLLSALSAEIAKGTDFSRGKSYALDLLASAYYLREEKKKDGSPSFFQDIDALAGTVLAFWCKVVDSSHAEGPLGTHWAFSKEAREVIGALEYCSFLGAKDDAFQCIRPLARALTSWVKYRVYGIADGLGDISAVLTLAWEGFDEDSRMIRLYPQFRKTGTDGVPKNMDVFDSDLVMFRAEVDDALLVLSGKTDFADLESKPEDVPAAAEKSRVLITPYLELVTLVGLNRMKFVNRADELTYAKATTVDMATWKEIIGDYDKLTRDQAVAVVETGVSHSAAAIDELYLLTDLAYSVLINGWNFMGTEYRVTNDRSWDSSKPFVATEYTNTDEDGAIYVGPTVHMDHAIAQAWIEGIEKAGVTFADGARW